MRIREENNWQQIKIKHKTENRCRLNKEQHYGEMSKGAALW